MFIGKQKFYGGTTVGEKGQIVLPADLRRDLGIKSGDKLAVLVLEKDGFPGIVFVKDELVTTIIGRFFGGKVTGLTRNRNSDQKENKK